MAKRANGAGSIEVLPSGKARITFSKWGRKKRETFNSEEEAQKALDTIAVLRAEGELVDSEETLITWGEKWLTDRELHGSRARAEVKDVATERSRWQTHVMKSKLAKMPLAKIRAKDVDAFCVWVRNREAQHVTKGGLGRPISLGTQRHLLALVTLCLTAAVKEGLIKSNPAIHSRIATDEKNAKKQRAFDEDWLRADEMDCVLSCEALSVRDRTAYACAIGLSLRLNDLKAIKLCDIFLDSEVPGPHVKVEIGKTGKFHKVPVLPWLMPWLREWIAGLPAKATHLFPTRDGGPYKSRTFDFNWAEDKRPDHKRASALHRAGIHRKVKFHDLRGTCATHLALGTWGRKWSLHEIKSMLAHGDQRVTERYVRRALDTLSAAAQGTLEGPRCPSLPMARVKHRNHSHSDSRAETTRQAPQGTVIVTESAAAWATPISHEKARELLRAVADGSNIQEHATALARTILDSEGVRLASRLLEAPGSHPVADAVRLAALVLGAGGARGEAEAAE